MLSGSVGTLDRLLRDGHRAVLLAAAALGTASMLAAHGGRGLCAAEQGALRDVPYSAPVLSVMDEARRAIAAGQPSEALVKLHQVLEFATPAFTVEKLELHRQVARAFAELGYPDHAVRTLQAALQDARVAGHDDIARAIEEDLKSVGLDPTAAARGREQQAGWLTRFLGSEHAVRHDRPVRPYGHQPVQSPGVVPGGAVPGQVASEAPQSSSGIPAVPLSGPEGVQPGHVYPVQPNSGSLYPHAAHAHGHAARRISVFDRIRHWWHSWMPQARARRSYLAPRPVTPPALPQYPVAGCENCRKRGLNPSVAHPPAPPLGTIPPVAGPAHQAHQAPLSPYSGRGHPHHIPPQVQASPVRPRRTGFLSRIGGLLRRPFTVLRRRNAAPIHQVSPGWPPVEPQLGGVISPDVYPR